MRRTRNALLLLPLLLLLAAALPAAARESEAVRSPRAIATLLAEAEAVAPGQPVRVGLRLRLAPGWHTYWKNAGDAGAPPEITLRLPEGATAGPIEWPAPERIPFGPLVNFGYQGEVLLPLAVTLPAGAAAPGDRLAIEAEATWLVCEQICIPEEGRFRLDLPVAAAARPDPAAAPLFAAAAAARPREAPAGWAVRATVATGDRAGRAASLILDGPGLSPATVRAAFFFPEGPDLLDHAAPQRLAVRDGGLTLALARAEGASGVPTTLAGVVTITDGAGQRASFAVAAPVAPAAAAPPPGLPLWRAAGFALLGGLLLNLMPCVFPVLAMKAMALARLSGAARREVRASAVGYTAGVLLAFAALGGLLIGLRAAGTAAGWGFQFTAPAFVAGMSWLMLAVGLNLSGVFAVGAGVLARASGGTAARGGPLGSLATGVLAVLVATPCTAPFMAASIGAALAMPPAATLAVFLALGLGLAAPYAALALAPGLARALPRPGPWMERLRQGLAFPMYGAAAWLVWVLAQQAGPDGVLAALAGGVLVGFGAWAVGTAQRAAAAAATDGGGGGRGARRIALAAALAAAIGAAALLPGLAATSPAATAGTASAESGDGSEPWSEARLAALRAEGRPVFVNLTAAWCITCQVNERVALRAAAVRDAFAGRGVAYLKGDWTRGDPAVGALLRAHGREGVPLYLLYPADGGLPAILPQILTEGVVLRALAELPTGAGGGA